MVEENSFRGEAVAAVKRIVAFVATSKVPSISPESLCRELGISKMTLYGYLDALERAGALRRVRPCGTGFKGIRSGSKIFLGEPNIYYALGLSRWNLESNLGTIREAFFVSQLHDFGICAPPGGNFRLSLSGEEITFEIGGPSKGTAQILNLTNGYVLRDGIEIGHGNIIPLFLAGFLY